jgi:hypothetical protein
MTPILQNKLTNRPLELSREIRTIAHLLGLFLAVLMPLFGQAQSNCSGLSGRAFTDYNFDGLPNEIQSVVLSGVSVEITDALGNAQTVLTAADGSFSFPSAQAGQAYRLSFSLPSSLSHYTPTGGGGKPNGAVQFVTSPQCALAFGASLSEDFCDANPYLLVPCYVNGDPLNTSGTAKDSVVLVGFPNNAPSASQPLGKIGIAKASELGSIWGVAYNRRKKAVITTSNLRRHSGFGPAGTGGIYFLDFTNPTASSVLGSLTVPSAGADPRVAEGIPLSGNVTVPSYDTTAFQQVGKISLGGVAISDDQATLFTINLATRQLLKIDLSGFNATGALPTAADITAVNLPSPCGVSGEFRPWAVKFHHGKLYVGGVCSAEYSQDTADLKAYVYEYSGGSFSVLTDFKLSFKRGKARFNEPFQQWFPWVNFANEHAKMLRNDLDFIYPQPILSDIAFDTDGSLILGFLDRTGHQTGVRNFLPRPNFPFILANGISAGDIIRVCKQGNTYVLEGTAGACKNPGGTAVEEGPNGSEFYWSDYWPYGPTNNTPSDALPIHSETALGGLDLVPGSGHVAASIYDPFEASTGGATWFNNTTGKRPRSYEVYNNFGEFTNIGFFGKANGLGDVQTTCALAPISGGGRVWADCNGNGRQDAGETGLENIKIDLFNLECQFIQTTTTDASGNFGFTNLSASSVYHVFLGSVGQFSGNTFTNNGSPFLLSPANASGVSDNIDADFLISGLPACAQGRAYIKFQTGSEGSSVTDLGAGLVAPSLASFSVSSQNESCRGGNDGKISVTASISLGVLEYSINDGSTWQTSGNFENLSPGNYIVRLRIAGATQDYICNNSVRNIDIQAGTPLVPPTTQGDFTCQYNVQPRDGGLKATCAVCPRNYVSKITWWTAATGGTQVAEGGTFNPIQGGYVDASVVGTYYFYAQCACGENRCVSERTPAIFHVRPLPEPTVSGKKLVCAGSSETYSTHFVEGSTWVWTLTSGGTITQNNGNEIVVTWDNITQGSTGHLLRVLETNSFGCQKYNEISVSIKSILLTCRGSLNMSIDGSCRAQLRAQDLATAVGSGVLKVQLLNAGNQILEEGIGSVLLDGITPTGSSYPVLGQHGYKYRVTEDCGNNACWGFINFEDYLPPTITCPADITLGCSQVQAGTTPIPAVSGAPIVTDCSHYTVTYSDQVFETSCLTPFTAYPSALASLASTHPFPAQTDIFKIIVRGFRASDQNNNASTCQQVIFLRKGNIQNVICPADFEIECQNVVNLDPSVTGSPILDIDGDFNTTYDRAPISQSSCLIDAAFSDLKIDLCTGSYKILRTWTIYDWCQIDNPNTPDDERRKVCTQLIKVLDKTPPTVSAEFTQYYTENGGDVFGRDTTAIFDGFSLENAASSAGSLQDIWALGMNTTCGGKALLTLRAKDEFCTQGAVGFTTSDSRFVLRSINFDAVNNETVAIYEGTFNEYGDFNVTFTAADACGYAKALKTFVVRVRDNIKPNTVCLSQTTLTLTNDGSGRILASSINNGSTDNCGIHKVEVRRMANCQNPNETNFRPYVDFYCCDAGSTVQVVVRVTDVVGNYNDCMVQVTVDDKLKPTCYAPPRREIRCEQLPLTYDFRNFGTASFWDNCGIKDTLYTQRVELNNCKVGTVTRKWVISDIGGKKDSCTQIINVIGKSDFIVDFPDDKVFYCSSDAPTADQTRDFMLQNNTSTDGHLQNLGCGVLAVEVHDDTIRSAPDACYKVFRKISVIDWCAYNPNNILTGSDDYCYGKPVCGDVHSNANWTTENTPSWQILARPTCTNPRERRFQNADGLGGIGASTTVFEDGIICFIQTLKVVDTTAPQFVQCVRDTTFADFSLSGCSGTATVSVLANDFCQNRQLAAQGVRYAWSLLDAVTNATVVSGTGSTFSQVLPYDKAYRIVWMATDPCNNMASCTTNLKVVDAKKPSVFCRANGIAELMPNGNGTGSIDIWASEMFSSAADNCASAAFLQQSLAIELETQATANYPAAPSKKLPLNCTHLGQNNVRIWVRDSSGNANYCAVRITLQDNLGACNTQTSVGTIAGTITTERNALVANVEVKAYAANNLISNYTTVSTGNYSFSGLTLGQNYTLRANRNDNWLNGVTTADIALLSRHVLGTQRLSSAYKIVAADVNNDRLVSASDMLWMRRLVLRMVESIPNNTSWRFIDKAYTFTNPSAPFAEDFPSVVNVNNLSQTAQTGFMAVKLGDLNQTATPSLTDGSSSGIRNERTTWVLETEDKALKAGDVYEIELKTRRLNAAGFQFTLNTDGIDVQQMKKGSLLNFTDGNVAIFKNALTVSWNSENNAQNDAEADVMKLQIRARKSGRLSDFLALTSTLTTAEAYNTQGEAMNIALEFKGKQTDAEFTLFQNEPNPFDAETKISFVLPLGNMAKLTVFDASGRTVFKTEGNFQKGYNELTIQKSDLGTTGIYFYRLETGTHTAIKKMIID